MCVCISSWPGSVEIFLPEGLCEGDTASGFVKLVKRIQLSLFIGVANFGRSFMLWCDLEKWRRR
jgi:hypothetical protein